MEILEQRGTSTAALYWVSSANLISFTAAEQGEVCVREVPHHSLGSVSFSLKSLLRYLATVLRAESSHCS